MDRRQKKSRAAILSAFSTLVSKYRYHSISVQQIIDTANVGRTTFYAHFETKDALLQALCEELFEHILTPQQNMQCEWCAGACQCRKEDVFLHLLCHLQRNDRNVLQLLTGENNGLFTEYFKKELKKLIQTQFSTRLQCGRLPQQYLVDHIAASFVHTVIWWLQEGKKQSAQTVCMYFSATVEPFLKQ